MLYYRIGSSPEKDMPICGHLDFPFMIWRSHDLLRWVWTYLRSFSDLWLMRAVDTEPSSMVSIDREFAVFCDRARVILDRVPPPLQSYAPVPRENPFFELLKRANNSAPYFMKLKVMIDKIVATASQENTLHASFYHALHWCGDQGYFVYDLAARHRQCANMAHLNCLKVDGDVNGLSFSS